MDNRTENILSLLCQLGLTQTQVAEDLNISESAIYLYVKGKSKSSRFDDYISRLEANKNKLLTLQNAQKQIRVS